MSTELASPTRVTISDFVLDHDRFERASYTVGSYDGRLKSILPEKVLRDPNWTVVENGRVIPPEEWEKLCLPGSEVYCYPTPQDATTRVVLGSLLILAAFAAGPLGWGMIGANAAWFVGAIGTGLAIGGASELIIGPPDLPQIPTFGSSGGNQETSPTYGFEGIQNSTRVGAPIGVVYGKHRVGGQLLSTSIKTIDDQDRLDILIGLCEGEVSNIDTNTLEINGQPATNFTGVTIQTKPGTNDQAAISIFGDNTTATITADALMTETFITYTTNGTQLNAFEVKLRFPSGLFSLDNAGNFIGKSLTVELEYKLSTSSVWIPINSVTYSEAKRATLRRIIRVGGLPAGQYDIRVRRTSAETTSPRESDQIRREAVNEITNDQFSYPNTALLGLSAIATNQLSGGLPTVTVVVSGVKVKVFSNVNQYAIQFTQSPAWAALDLLTNERYGGGRFVWPTETKTGTVDVTNGQATVVGHGTLWLLYARKGQKMHFPGQLRVYTVLSVEDDEHLTLSQNWGGSTITGQPFELKRDDLDIQSFIDWDGFCGQSVLAPQGGNESRATFNMVCDTDGGKLWDSLVKVCGVGFAAPVKNGNYVRIKFQQAENSVHLFTMANVKKGSFNQRFLSLKERANYFEVQYLNEDKSYVQDMVVLEDQLLFTNEEPERRQTVSAYGVTRTGHAARLARFYQLSNRYITRTIEFEVDVGAAVVEPGDVINFQHDVPQWGYSSRVAPGSTSTTVVMDHEMEVIPNRTYNVFVRHVDGTTELKQVTNTPGKYFTLTVLNAWAIIPADGEVVAFGPVGIVTKPFRVVSVSRAQHMTFKIVAVEYSPLLFNDTAPPFVNQTNYSLLADRAGPPPAVQNLTLLEMGLSDKSLWVGFTPPGSSNYKSARVYRVVNNVNIFQGETTSNAFYIRGIPAGTTVTIRVTSVSTYGVESNLSSAPQVQMTLVDSKPLDVTGLSLAFEAGIAYLQWAQTSWVNQIEYEVRRGGDWDGGANLGRTTNLFFPIGGDGSYWVKAHDIVTGAYSTNPALLIVEGAVLGVNVVQTWNEEDYFWVGSVTGAAVVRVSDNTVTLGGTLFVDDFPVIDTVGIWDAQGGVGVIGEYIVPVSHEVDLGSVKIATVSAAFSARGEVVSVFWDYQPNFDAWSNVDGVNASSQLVEMFLAASDAFGNFGPWMSYSPGQYSGRKFKMKLVLTSTDPDVAPVVTAFDWTIDMPDRIDERINLIVPAEGVSVLFTPPFQILPSTVVTIVNATAGDDSVLTLESRYGFTIQVKNTGVGVVRVVNTVSKGY